MGFLSIVDIMEKCKVLQAAGHSVSFTVSYGETRIEHRDKESCELIVGFSMRDTENQNMLTAVNNYLDSIGK